MTDLSEVIAKSLGGFRSASGWMVRCLAHADSTPSLAICVAPDGKLLVHCHAGCSQTAVISSLQSAGLWPSRQRASLSAPAAPPKAPLDRSSAAIAKWQRALCADDSPVVTFLQSRSINLPPPARLRFAPALKHPSGNYMPAMVALVTGGLLDEPMGVLRTFLSPDGSSKTETLPARLMLGPCAGGAVRLSLATDMVMVGEGIETCLAAMQATGLPAWAALSTSGLRSLLLPTSIRKVTILADGDPPGRAAAVATADRWVREGRQVRIANAPDGRDFNDILMSRAAQHD